LILTAAFIGLGAAIANYAFHWLIRAFRWLFYEGLGEHVLGAITDTHHAASLTTGSAWLIALLPISGAALLVLLAKLFPGEVYGYGMPRFLERVNLKDARIPARNIVIKMFSAAITVGSGGSVGREGPIVQIGGTVGSVTASALGMSTDRTRLLVAAGSAAAIGAAFNAPIAGVMFAIEIILVGAFELQVFTMLIVAAATSVAFTRGLLDIPSVFGEVPELRFPADWTLALYLGLGVLLGLAAWLYNTMFSRINRAWRQWKVSQHVKPFVGAAMVGATGIFLFGIFGDGAEWCAKLLAEKSDAAAVFAEMSSLGAPQGAALALALGLLGMGVAKMLATSTTLGSGGAGGVFGPALFIGAMCGTAFGLAAMHLLPGTVTDFRPFTLVGMCAFLSASTHAPLTSIFLMFEITNRADSVLPILFASVLGTAISHRLNRESIDTIELAERRVDLHLGKEERVLERTLVAEVMRTSVERVNVREPLRELVNRVLSSRHTHFPVVDDEGRIRGIVGLNDIKSFLSRPEELDFLIALDAASTDVVAVRTDDTLRAAMARLTFRGFSEIPVVEPGGKLVGMLTHQDVINTYNKKVLQAKL
jgi:CIC family chloride channel protein